MACSLEHIPLHVKPVQWLRAETVSCGLSACCVNVVIDCGHCCRYRGLFSLFSAPGPFGEDHRRRGHVVECPAPLTCSSWRNLLTQAHLDAHTRAYVHACVHTLIHVASGPRLWRVCPWAPEASLGTGFLGPPPSSACSLSLSSRGRELRSWTVIRLNWWLKCLSKWSWWVIRLCCSFSLPRLMG